VYEQDAGRQPGRAARLSDIQLNVTRSHVLECNFGTLEIFRACPLQRRAGGPDRVSDQAHCVLERSWMVCRVDSLHQGKKRKMCFAGCGEVGLHRRSNSLR